MRHDRHTSDTAGYGYDGLFLQMFLRYVVQSASGTVK
jgi:hypothetical protein